MLRQAPRRSGGFSSPASGLRTLALKRHDRAAPLPPVARHGDALRIHRLPVSNSLLRCFSPKVGWVVPRPVAPLVIPSPRLPHPTAKHVACWLPAPERRVQQPRATRGSGMPPWRFCCFSTTGVWMRPSTTASTSFSRSLTAAAHATSSRIGFAHTPRLSRPNLTEPQAFASQPLCVFLAGLTQNTRPGGSARCVRSAATRRFPSRRLP